MGRKEAGRQVDLNYNHKHRQYGTDVYSVSVQNNNNERHAKRIMRIIKDWIK